MQTHRKPSFDALLPAKEDPLAMQSVASTDPLFGKQGDEKGDTLAIVPDSSPRAFSYLNSAPAHVSPPSPTSKNVNVRFIQIAIFDSDSGQQVRESRRSVKGNCWIRINLYPILYVRCNLCDGSPHAIIIHPRNCRFSSPLWPFDPGIHAVQQSHHSPAHSLQTEETQTVWIPPTSYCFLSFEGGVYTITKFKERSRCSKQEHYRLNMLQMLRTNHSIKDSLSAE
ncbi:hypothetical protein KP509_26G070600 [Ceratopteris richardii]|nr:hypothetical protein KP509_26G070600 [Ceratopteris richardii]